MPKGAVLVGFLAFVAAVIPALPARSEPAPVEANGTQFTPSEVSVPVDDMVRWHVVEGEHTITSDDGLFDSGPVNRGTIFVARFHKAGRYPYYCRVHGGPGGKGMSGLVIVGTPETTTTTAPPATTTTAPTTTTTTAVPTTTTTGPTTATTATPTTARTAPTVPPSAPAAPPVPESPPTTVVPVTVAEIPQTTAPSAATLPRAFPSTADLGPVDGPNRDRRSAVLRTERLTALPASADDGSEVEGVRDVVVLIAAGVMVVFGLLMARPDRKRRA